MAINFPNSPSNGATHTAGGQTFTYDGTAGVWNPPAAGNAAITTDGSTPSLASGITGAEVRTLIGAGESAARTAVYANIAALPTSGTAGDMAYVTATNRLYIWTGTGWYNIALINNNPTISGVSSSYALAIDGTATTVTITATDPEGLPITYSIVSDTSGNAATVAQGTGSSTNVFTITPSTNTAHAGTFSLTFRASDGVNIASAAASFTLEFKVVNSNYTTGLFTSVGANNAVNAAFDDKSTNDHTITAVGNATQTTFSPYRHGGYSVYFDGSGDYLASDNNNIGNFGTGDFTVEGWLWVPDHSALYTVVDGRPATLTSATGWSVAINTSGGIYVYSGGTIITGTNGDVTTNTWHHYAFTRSGSNIKLFLNGTQQGSTYTTARDYTANLFRVGGSGTGGEVFKGYQRDVRVVKGTALYTSNFTKPDEPLTAVTNTTFLGCHLPYVKDGSTNDHTIAINGDPSTEPFAPFDAQEYAAADHGGSISLDGTGDSIQITGGSDFTFTGDFTAECWVYCNAHTNDYAGILGFSHDSQSTGWNVLGRSNGKLHFNVGMTYTDTTGSLPLNQWVHLALVRNGSSSGNCKLYINGVADATTVTKTGTVTQPTFIQIGQYPGIAARAFNGNIADVRVVNGTAVYTSNFTPTTAPLTAVTNTKLLVQSTDAGIIDKAQTSRFVKLLGNTKSSTTQTKFLSSSMYFDGTGDYIEADDQDIGNFGTGDFTVEGWFYLTASPSNYITVAETRGSGGSTTGWVMAISAGDFYVYSGAFIGAKGSAISSNTWYHWAFTRSGTDQKVFLNGTQTGSTYTTARNYTDNNFTIGAKHDASEFFTGYQSDVRITKGLARYTSNFTAPTAALKG